MLDIGLDRQIEIMLKFDISAEQWFFLELLWVAQQHKNGSVYLYKYFYEKNIRQGLEDAIDVNMIKDLIAKKILRYTSNGTPSKILDLDQLEIIEGSKWFISLHAEGYEFFAAYPPHTYDNNGRAITIKNIASKFNNVDEFAAYYCKEIKYNRDLHNKNMEVLERCKNLGLVNSGIINWVVSRKWLDLLVNAKDNV